MSDTAMPDATTTTTLPVSAGHVVSVQSSHLSDEERAIYDRQLRVWGVEAQKRMRESSVLLVGLRGLAAEVGKNLCLAGIGSLVLLDGEAVSVADLSANFLLRAEDVGRNRAEACVAQLQVLNPNVAVTAMSNSAELTLQATPELFTRFRAVCLVGQSIAVQTRVNQLLREHAATVAPLPAPFPDTITLEPATTSTAPPAAPVPTLTSDAAASAAVSAPVLPAFFSAECMGLHGFFFEDLQRHAFSEARKLKDAATGKESEEEVVVAGEQRYERSVAHVLDAQAAGQSVAELSKKFGRRGAEKAALQLWLAVRTLLQWREQQLSSARVSDAAASVASVAPSSDATTLASLTAFRDAQLSLSGDAAERVLPAHLLGDLLRTLGLELAHTSAVVGGILAQEILKVISAKDRPLSNTFVASVSEGYGIIKEL